MNPVKWFEIYVNDLDRATRFYESVLKLRLSELPSPDPNTTMRSFPMDQQSPGAAGAIVKTQGLNVSGNGTVVYFGSEDCSQEAGRVETAGGRLFMPKTSIGPHGFIVLAYDTEENLFGVHSTQ